MEAGVRPATLADAREIARVHVETWRAAYAHVFPAEFLAGLSIDDRAALAEHLLTERSETILVAEVEGRVVGFASGGPSRDDDPGAAPGEVYAIYVEPAAWGRGAGRLLLQRLEEALLGSGFDDATLWVLEDNPRARRFYEAAGWEFDGGREMFSRGGVDAWEIRYRKRLG
jgi:GNAT superfamily N-acetyltransferase